LIEELGPPGVEAIVRILEDTVGEVAPDSAIETDDLQRVAVACAAASADARQVRKLVLRAVTSRRDLALAPELLTEIGRAACRGRV